MKHILLATIVLLGTACVGYATTTDELEFTSGTESARLTDGEVSPADPGTCTAVPGKSNACSAFIAFTFAGTHYYDTNPDPQTITVSADSRSNLFNGWSITTVTGNSSSPGLDPYGLDVGVLITCETSACVGTAGELTLTYSDTGFSTPGAELQTSYSGTETGYASTTATAYYSTTDNLFAETYKIGTVGPIVSHGTTTTVAGTTTDGPSPTNTLYSLTLADVFEANAVGASFSTDLDITSEVPEPGAVILFGTVLVFCTAKLRKRLVP